MKTKRYTMMQAGMVIGEGRTLGQVQDLAAKAAHRKAPVDIWAHTATRITFVGQVSTTGRVTFAGAV